MRHPKRLFLCSPWKPDPRAVVCSIVFCMVGTFLIRTPPELVIALLLWMGLCFVVKINPLIVLKNAFAPALVLILITTTNLFFNVEGTPLFRWGILNITTVGVQTFMLFSFRLTLLVLWGSIVLTALPASVCALAVQSLLSPLRKVKAPIDALTDVTVLSFRFLPVVVKEYEVLRAAQELRGKCDRFHRFKIKETQVAQMTQVGQRIQAGKITQVAQITQAGQTIQAGKITQVAQIAQVGKTAQVGQTTQKNCEDQKELEKHKSHLRRGATTAATVVPLLRALLRHATNLSAALDSRAYEVGQKRTYLTPFCFDFLDLTMCILCVGFIVFLIVSW